MRGLHLLLCILAVNTASAEQRASPESCTRGHWRKSTRASYRRRRAHRLEVSAECVPCAPGRMMPLYHHQETDCFACASGLWNDLTGASECKGAAACAAGSWGLEGATHPGYPCHPCAAGQFQSLTGQDRCRSCTSGTFSADPGSSACEEAVSGGCPAGTHGIAAATSRDQASCKPCPIDSANPHPGGECHRCSEGRHQPDPGQAECLAVPTCPRFEAWNKNARACEARHPHIMVLVIASWTLCVLSVCVACTEEDFPCLGIVLFIVCMGIGIFVTQTGKGFISEGSFWTIVVFLSLSALVVVNTFAACLLVLCKQPWRSQPPATMVSPV